MDTKNTNSEQDFPGYPSHSPSEDITNQADQVEIGQSANPGADDEENIIREPANKEPQDVAADVTEDDIKMLSASDQNRDLEDEDLEEAKLDNTDNDGDPLNEATGNYNRTGDSLDVPGSEDDDADENVGSEDEENNYYSLGGDNHENLEEDNTST